ncbi:MAG: thioesterase [Oscillospiraceae bacterium]|nr:thioesterase [Oscillospiraceae bacterium]
MGYVFKHTHTIPDNDSDLFGVCRPGALQSIMQEAGNMHSAQIGYARDDLGDGIVWVLVKAFLRLNRPVTRKEEITVSTWHRGNLGAQFYRDYDVHAGDEHVGEAVTSWVMFDLNRQRPVRPGAAAAEELFYTPPNPKTLVIGKPQRPETVLDAGTRPIRYSDLDMNGHVNNIKYMDILCDTLRLEERAGVFLKSAEIHYVGQTLPGQMLALETGTLPGGRLYVSGAVSGKRTFEAIAELGGR